MQAIELTASQEATLTALLNLHSETEGAVKGEAIAEVVNRNPGTIRNQMQSLKALQLVEGVPGPKGGYKPTAEAYHTLDMHRHDADLVSVPVTINDEEQTDLTVTEITLASIHHPELCRAMIDVQGRLGEINEGDEIVVGPTPLSGLAVEGTVDAIDHTKNILSVCIERMEAPVDSE